MECGLRNRQTDDWNLWCSTESGKNYTVSNSCIFFGVRKLLRDDFQLSNFVGYGQGSGLMFWV